MLKFPAEPMTTLAAWAFTDALQLIFAVGGCAALVAAASSAVPIADGCRAPAEVREAVTE